MIYMVLPYVSGEFFFVDGRWQTPVGLLIWEDLS